MQSLFEVTIARTHMTHKMLLEVVEPLSEAQFGWEPGPEAPPVGWHLWHMARWADRVQAALSGESGKPIQEIWVRDQLVQRWELDPDMLGTLQTGMSMEHDESVRVVREVGKERHVEYARQTFAACDAAIDRLRLEDFDSVRTSVKAYRITGQRIVVEAPPEQATIASEVLFHLHHGSRHLGMIEGLMGAQGINGTASA